MANPEVALVVENSEEKAEETLVVENLKQRVASTPDSNSETTMQKFSMKGEKGSSKEWTSKEDILDPKVSFLQMWTKIFLTSCLFAVLLDPLFLYIPIIDRHMNCLGLDKNLKITTLILRSATDVFYLLDIIVQVYRSDNCSGLIKKIRHRRQSKFQFLWNCFLPTIAKTIWRSYILIDILAILPFPQVAILIFLSNMRGSPSLNIRKVIMNFSVLMQYMPRILRIYFLCKELRYTPKGESGETAIWVKGVLNFFMYILSSHVLGAVWYFFAIQRLLVCWQYACRNQNACDSTSAFGCHHRHTFRNITLLNNLCPISPVDTMRFDFGIFLSLLQSGIPESTSFLHKFLNCFCWGLQNLSSLGSNLRPSTNAWENLFVAFISIIGLLLFIYLIGNLQTYMQLDMGRIEEHRHKIKMERKIEEKTRELEWWLTKNGIPEKSKNEIKLQIIKKVQQELEENRDADINRILSILPWELHGYIKSCMPLTKLKQVPMLQNMDEQVLQAICDHLKPMKYTDNTVIVQEGEPQMMLLIVDGTVGIEKKWGSNLQQYAGELYGEKLLAWPSWISFPDKLPLATESAKAIGDVEALVLMSSDMKNVGCRFSLHFGKYDKVKEQLANNLGYVETKAKLFTAEVLKKATNNYHDTHILGEGRSGIVYKGVLTDQTGVVIKKTSKFSSPAQSDQIVNDVISYSRINHKNMVRLLGCCLETELPLLIYEFIDNGTLYEHIHGRNGRSPLSLSLRLKIAAETAGALAHLHHSTTPAIIHRDVTTTNILLDVCYTAKLSEFVTSLVPEDEYELLTFVVCTPGYLDPEYLQSSTLTEKSDVYSFGVVLAELLTRRKAVSFDRPEVERNLANVFTTTMDRGFLRNILDDDLVGEGNLETIQRVADLARRCLSLGGKERPAMNSVARELEELQNMAKDPRGKTAVSPSPKDMDDSLGSHSNAYLIDGGSSGITSAD